MLRRLSCEIKKNKIPSSDVKCNFKKTNLLFDEAGSKAFQ